MERTHETWNLFHELECELYEVVTIFQTLIRLSLKHKNASTFY